jgi:ribonucleoside-diphosphate reductase alpha chain
MEIKNPVLKQIWQDRYAKENEVVDDNLKRVAKHCSTNKNEYNDFFNVMNEGLFFPAGRTMSNSGVGKDLTLSNCFCLNFVEDSIADIFETVKLAAITHQKGGGTGFEFSKIRPSGTKTSNEAVASGVVSFLEVFDAQTATILQQNRRGANMGILSIYHPDIYNYLNSKSFDVGKLTHFNLSVMVDDDFMNAKNNNENIYLHYPIYDEKGHMIKDESKWTHKTEVSAVELWDLIMQKAYDTGEYGVFFYDNLNKDNNTWYMETIVTTNPCFTGDMRLLTNNGYKKFEELCDSETEIINKDGDVSTSRIWCSGEKEVIELSLTNKTKIKCTPNHVFLVADDSECEAKDLEGKRIQFYHGKPNLNSDLFVKLGFIQGDGSMCRINSETHLGLEINIGYKDSEVFDLFNITPIKDKHSYYTLGYNEYLIKYGFDGSPLPERVFPITYTSWEDSQKLNFLKGCYSANGSIIKGYRIAYKTTSKVFALQLQKALLEFNISAYITTNKPKLVKFKNGEYMCKESFDINITRLKDIIIFYQSIGFMQNYKMNDLISLIKLKSPKVRSIKSLGIQKVYDFNEPLTHWGIVEGVIAHNCGEYLSGLLFKEEIDTKEYFGACNLGSLFLHKFVQNPFTKDAYIDYEKLKDTIRIAVRFLDNILDINKYPHVNYENYQKNMRTVGLGISGLADLFTMLNMKYGDEESILLTDKLMNFITSNAYLTSIDLSKEKGSFNFLDKDKFIQSGFIQKHLKVYPTQWSEIINGIKEHGIRNARIISIAPTGTLSLAFGNNCSSGIEPIFSLEYDRKVKMGGQSEEHIQIVSMKDYAYSLWQDVKEGNIVNKDIFVTAMNLGVDKHINILKTVAYHTDMSISKTINIPTEYSFEDTKNVYNECWKAKIKGCTIFRPNPIRQGILIDTNNKKKETNTKKEVIEKNEYSELGWGTTLDASDDLIGRKKKIISGCGALHLQGWFDSSTGRLLEIFLSKGSSGGCNSFMGSLSRMTSLALRTGVDFDYAIDQLKSAPACPSYVARTQTKKDCSKGNNCPSAIANALIEMQKEIYDELVVYEDDIEIKENIEVKTEVNKLSNDESSYLEKHGEIAFAKKYHKCPICSDKLNNSEGCLSCQNCGFSKCG